MKMSDKPAYIVYNTQIEYRQLKLNTGNSNWIQANIVIFQQIYTFCNKSTIEIKPSLALVSSPTNNML